MKVYGLTITPNPSWGATTRQVRAVVAARSMTAAAQAFRDSGLTWSNHLFRQYASETGNDAEIEAATQRPGVVLWTDEVGVRSASDYRAVTPEPVPHRTGRRDRPERVTPKSGVWPPANWCAELNPERTHICDQPSGHDGDHKGPELPTVDIDEAAFDSLDAEET